MSWRGQGGGRRAKGRRGDQDPELDNTAWLAELEREAAAQADDDEEDWASTLRGRRSPTPPAPSSASPAPAAPADPGRAPADPGRVPADPGWAPADPAPPPPSDYAWSDAGSDTGAGAWSDDPVAADPLPDPDPDWAWRQPAGGGYGEPTARSDPDPAAEAFGEPRPGAGAGTDWGGPAVDPGDGGWRSAGADTPTETWSAEEPVDREPDYPALFGELYRRSAAQQDPIWEAPPAAEPPPEHGQPDPSSSAWPFEETTQTWEPSDRSFIWPSDELPQTSGEWDQPTSRPWLDDPAPQPPTTPSAFTPDPAPPRPDPYLPPPPDETAAWPPPGPAAEASPWVGQPGAGNGLPPSAAPVGPPPEDWAAAIPTDVPAARRAADPAAATRMWRPDEAEPGVPLGGARARGRAPEDRAEGSRAVWDDDLAVDDEPAAVRRKAPAKARRAGGERQARAWPRTVAVISWIVLVMVVCWFYVFPWLERVLPENF
jgi:hypothetical protein